MRAPAIGGLMTPSGGFKDPVTKQTTYLGGAPRPKPRTTSAPRPAPAPSPTSSPLAYSPMMSGPSMSSLPSFSPSAPSAPSFFMQQAAPSSRGPMMLPDAGGLGGNAMAGLSTAIQKSGPAPGWADDPALMATADQLGQRTPPQALGVLSRIVGQRGRLY